MTELIPDSGVATDQEDAVPPAINPSESRIAKQSSTASSTAILFLRLARTHDPRLRDRLIVNNGGLVRHIAFKLSNGSESLEEDLIQVGNIGLIKAIDRFDPSRHVKFITYAVPTITGEMKRYLRDSTWSIGVAREMKELYTRIPHAKAYLTSRLGRVPTVPEMAQELKVSEEELLRAMELTLIRYTLSLNNPVRYEDDEGSATVSDGLGRSAPSTVDEYIDFDLDHAIGELKPNERATIIGRYYEDMTQAAIGERLRVSQMQVSRLHRKALMQLRERCPR